MCLAGLGHPAGTRDSLLGCGQGKCLIVNGKKKIIGYNVIYSNKICNSDDLKI